MHTNADSSSRNEDIKVYKYRWIVLCIFCMFTVTNFMQFLQYTIISNIVVKYYNVEGFEVDATGLVFFLINILLFLPVSFLIEKYSLKITALVSTGLTVAGNLVKLLSVHPSRFYAVIIGQVLCAIGQVYMLSIPSKFASAWFGPDEVSTACAIAVLGTQLGAAIGSIIPPLLVKKNEDNEEIGKGLQKMLISYAVVTSVIFIIVVLFFRAKPKLPPSKSQLQLLEVSEQPPSFFQNCKKLVRNRDFLLLLLIFGLFNGLWNSFGILINTLYTHYFPDGENDVGVITLLAIIAGGCIGSVVFGLILDKTHKFKTTSFVVTLMSAVTFSLVLCTFLTKSRIGTYVAIPSFGFFIASGLLISFEYTIEVTYPIPESVSCSIMNATIFTFAIICTLVLEGLMNAIGYLYTFVCILVVLLLCSFSLFLISSNLRRRNANVTNEDMQNGDQS